jgi:NADH dehydrogenase FAD-containing subunit
MQNGHPVPGVAQAAIQEGRYVGRLIAKELKRRRVKRPFRYFDKGNLAVVGKNYAVLERNWLRTSGFLTWVSGINRELRWPVKYDHSHWHCTRRRFCSCGSERM